MSYKVYVAMSATYHLNAKKKASQDELRKLMAEKKAKSVKPGKIVNPLAKYNDAGQLMCVLCKSIVRTENVWQVHVNAKQHKSNVAEALRLKELTNNFTTTVKIKQKRPGTPPEDSPESKKPKGILKNASTAPVAQLYVPKNNAPNIISFHDEEIKRTTPQEGQMDGPSINPSTSSADADQSIKAEQVQEQPIPEGFFDDPILDAKVRNIEYKDPVEEEWEKFQKEKKEEASASAEIIAGEQEEATAERQIEEIDEQMRNWSRVLDIELKKEEIKKKVVNESMSSDEDGEDAEDIDIDEFLDWRTKRSTR